MTLFAHCVQYFCRRPRVDAIQQREKNLWQTEKSLKKMKNFCRRWVSGFQEQSEGWRAAASKRGKKRLMRPIALPRSSSLGLRGINPSALSPTNPIDLSRRGAAVSRGGCARGGRSPPPRSRSTPLKKILPFTEFLGKSRLGCPYFFRLKKREESKKERKNQRKKELKKKRRKAFRYFVPKRYHYLWSYYLLAVK